MPYSNMPTKKPSNSSKDDQMMSSKDSKKDLMKKAVDDRTDLPDDTEEDAPQDEGTDDYDMSDPMQVGKEVKKHLMMAMEVLDKAMAQGVGVEPPPEEQGAGGGDMKALLAQLLQGAGQGAGGGAGGAGGGLNSGMMPPSPTGMGM